MVYVIQVCRLLLKLVHLVGFITKKYIPTFYTYSLNKETEVDKINWSQLAMYSKIL